MRLTTKVAGESFSRLCFILIAALAALGCPDAVQQKADSASDATVEDRASSSDGAASVDAAAVDAVALPDIATGADGAGGDAAVLADTGQAVDGFVAADAGLADVQMGRDGAGFDAGGMALFCVRAGATGDGSSWDNALPQLPAELVRNAIYLVADGDYHLAGYDFDDAATGQDLIWVRKATASDHGPGAGWQSDYGDGQATFGSLVFSGSHILFDGVYDYGFRVVGGFQGTIVEVEGSADQVTIRHCDLDGDFQTDSNGYHIGGVCNGLNLHGSNIRLANNDIHNIADDGVGIYGENIELIGNRVHRLHGCGTDGACGPCYNGHSDGLELQNTTNVTIRGNLLYDIESTAALITGQWTAGNYTRNLILENNIFYTPATGLTVYIYYVMGARIVNNVIWGRTQGSRYGGLAIGPEVTDMELRNNIILNINFSHLGGAYDSSQHHMDHNLYGMISGSEYTANSNELVGDPSFAGIAMSGEAGDHPAQVSAEDFRLQQGSQAINNADPAFAPDTDFFGVLRGADPDIGPIEH